MKMLDWLYKLNNITKEKKNSLSQLYYMTLLFGLLSGLWSCDKKLDYNDKKPNHRIDSVLSNYDQKFDVQLKRDQNNYRNYADLYAWYLWYFEKSKTWKLSFWKVQMSDTLKIKWDAHTIMHTLWEKKFQRDNKKKFTVAKEFYDDVISQIDFNSVAQSNIEEYKNDIKEMMEEVKSWFDYDQIKQEKFRNINKYHLWKELCDMIDENMILSYNMTEFFPIWSPWWQTEYRFLDYMLKNYGKEFVFNVPAIHDDYASFGSYQFTSLALYDTNEETRGASIMNQYVSKDSQIPWSVTKLRGSEHHKAAYLLAMQNVYLLLKNLDEKQTKNIIDYVNVYQDIEYILPQIMAIGHNFPADLKKVAQFMLHHKNEQFLHEYMEWSHTEEYARKTFQNYIALKKWVEYVHEPIIIKD
jgi:hypothetical protein